MFISESRCSALCVIIWLQLRDITFISITWSDSDILVVSWNIVSPTDFTNRFRPPPLSAAVSLALGNFVERETIFVSATQQKFSWGEVINTKKLKEHTEYIHKALKRIARLKELFKNRTLYIPHQLPKIVGNLDLHVRLDVEQLC